jgi:hypothetical protein
VLGPNDISTKVLLLNRSGPTTWDVSIDLNGDAAKRLDRWAASHPGQSLAVVDDSTVLVALPLNDPPFHGHFTVNTDWDHQGARRFLGAVGGRDITKTVTTFAPPPTAKN